MIEGRYFAPMSARASAAKMVVAGRIATISVEGEAEPIVVQIVSIAAKLGMVPRRVELDSGAVFEAPADADFDLQNNREAGMMAGVFNLENSWRNVAIIAVATIVLIAGIFRYGLPIAANGAAWVTPKTVMSLIDAGTLDTVDRTLLGESVLPKERQVELEAQFKKLAANAETGGIPLNLVFRSSPYIGPNAFALPGGTIIMTDELVTAAKNDDEIAGVLAHEIGHVEQRHSMQMLYRVAGLAVMVGVISGDSGQLVDQVVGQASALQQLSYSREFEDKADRRSVELMVGLGRDPIAFVSLISRITAEMTGEAEPNADGEETDSGWLSTHPGSADRLSTVKAHADELGWKP